MNALLKAQQNEITEYHIYRRLAAVTMARGNSRVLKKLSDEELAHYEFIARQTGQEVKPSRVKILAYVITARILGLTFALKLMERGEKTAQDAYGGLHDTVPEVAAFANDEARHESELLEMLDEERLKYVGSMVLGLNDALVELTGVLAGLTLAFSQTRLIAMTGLITGIAAALSMGASEYLSTRTEGGSQDPLKASLYTGVAYLITVALLVAPYLILKNPYICIGLTVSAAVLIILVFTFYIAVARDTPFWKRFLEMVLVSLSVAALSFVIGFLVKSLLGVEA